MTLDWSSDGIRIITSRGEVRFGWEDFHARYAGRITVLLMQSDALFNFVPKRILTPEQAAAMVDAR